MTVPPLDEAGFQDRVLMAEIGKLNEQLGRYVLRYLAADALQAEPISVTEEQTLANTMTTLAAKVQQRANRRVTSNAPPALEGDAALRRQINGRPSERC
jgi:hypothetical protein